jgi:transcriptional regulator with XRE-family HTH domain
MMKVDYKALGERIAKRRKVLNMTQDDLAEATGLSNNHISNIENNHSIPSIDTLMKVCDAIETTPNYLLLGIATHTDNEDDLQYQISQRIKLCDPKKLRLIERFISWIIDEDV